MHEDILIEVSRFMRECEQAVLDKIASQQIGECFADIEGESNVKEEVERSAA